MSLKQYGEISRKFSEVSTISTIARLIPKLFYLQNWDKAIRPFIIVNIAATTAILTTKKSIDCKSPQESHNRI